MKTEDVLQFRKPTYKDEKAVMEFKQEFVEADSSLDETNCLEKYDDYSEWLKNVEAYASYTTIPNKTHVTSSTYLVIRESDKRLIGMVNIRHTLNDFLLRMGCHIGDGVRPTERRKGYATEIIRLALEKCREFGIQKVLITCRKDNIGSAKSIQANGGQLENEILEKEYIMQRYWIKIK